MIGIAPQEWKTDLPEFCEKTRDFYAGKMDKGSYKGFSDVTAVMHRKAARRACCVCV